MQQKDIITTDWWEEKNSLVFTLNAVPTVILMIK